MSIVPVKSTFPATVFALAHVRPQNPTFINIKSFVVVILPPNILAQIQVATRSFTEILRGGEPGGRRGRGVGWRGGGIGD